MSEPLYIIGIDLGTTNSIIAYTEAVIEKGKQPDIRVLEIPQLVAPGTVENRSMLPSFVFIPGKHDVAEDALRLPWNPDNTLAVGEFGRERGAELPQRLIASAKSWLCNPMVDRNEAILPWEGGSDVTRLSPVEASAEILKHIREAWNHTMCDTDADHDDRRIEYQQIYLTVPASFDAVARDLTVKAAQMAGLENVTLLEEPQAAFYAWIDACGEDWRKVVTPGDVILVCDIGGGTSDFSLIEVSEEEGNLVLERRSVGDHLLVGGDNMDLALAYSLAGQLTKKKVRLDNWQMQALSHSCRKAKETLLSNPETESYPITLLGRGSSLIGGTIKTRLEQDEVEKVIVDGFFPECERSARPAVQQRMGLSEMGLAYESDPAITRHIAKFLSSHGGDTQGALFPNAVFFNGGVMKSTEVRKRVMDVIASWSDQPDSFREIETRDFDLSVARGAAYYGLARKGKGIRIRGGLGKSYYISIAAAMPAVPGMPVPTKALCVSPFGMEEGTDAVLKDREFVLIVGEPVKFDIMTSSSRFDDTIGDVVEEWDADIEDLTSIETTLDGDYGSFIPVTIEIRVTEVGTLEFWCVSKADERRWKLEFNVREQASAAK